jgi:hypothetical protein
MNGPEVGIGFFRKIIAVSLFEFISQKFKPQMDVRRIRMESFCLRLSA